jgi:DNA primase
VAFGGRALGDEIPKYMNSPETPIYSKSHVLYHLDRAKEALRRSDFAVLVEGYMDAIAVARAGISNVVASCGTSLAEPQIKLLSRFTKRVIINYDPDNAGQLAAERSVSLLLEQDFEVRVLALPPVGDKKADPDLFIREKGAEEYTKLLKEAPPYVDYLIARARKMDLTTGEGKKRAVNFLLPYIQKIPNTILRSEWATRVAQQLRVDEPVMRAALSKAATQRHSELKIQPELVGHSAKPVERRLIRMLAEAEGFRRALAERLQAAQLHHGLETEKVFAALIARSLADEPLEATAVARQLEERDRRMLFEILFEEASEPTWEEAVSCVEALQHRQAERELADVQRSIEANPPMSELRGLLEKKQDLMRRLAAAR